MWIKTLLMLGALLVVTASTGCLGDRHERNIPAADLDLWNSADRSEKKPGYGWPRYIRRDQTLPDRGTLPGGSTLPGVNTLPRGTLPRGTLPRRGTLPSQR